MDNFSNPLDSPHVRIHLDVKNNATTRRVEREEAAKNDEECGPCAGCEESPCQAQAQAQAFSSGEAEV
jgi:MinD superfamily P-loop ATPase